MRIPLLLSLLAASALAARALMPASPETPAPGQTAISAQATPGSDGQAAAHPADKAIRPPSGPLGTLPTGTGSPRARTPTAFAGVSFATNPMAVFNEPWAMAFLPDGRLLVTEKGGTLRLFNPATSQTGTITGVPTVSYGGQGGLGDVALHPGFAQNGLIYLSYAEAGTGSTRGAAVARATLTLNGSGGGSLSNLQVIWRQVPKVSGQGHYSHRMVFDRNGKLFVSSGERQQFTPAQDMQTNLGKIVRLNDDGTVPADNPFAAQGGVAAQVWTLGHRNVLGLAFDAKGRLWEHEMGPMGGDELNLIQRGKNYGWPIVSNGDNYDGSPIPDHDTRPEFEAPKAWWTPVIAPAGFIVYSGTMFPALRGQGVIAGLVSQGLVRVRLTPNDGREIQRYPLGRRIREVEQGPDGALWVLEDGSNARLLKLTRP